jgi:hypothetical protein
MYDVIYIDALGTETPIALDQNDRAAAADLARRAAAERGAGRVVLPWSTNPRNCDLRRAVLAAARSRPARRGPGHEPKAVASRPCVSA